ncbi:MAG: hypothetical protein P8N76_25580 [Pirellulaceae bacterium]|nr:hypothetical protein [Pirellulaceae bacterium]
MLSVRQFTNQLFDLKVQYRQDNAWVGNWNESWNNEAVMTRFIGFAYTLCAATARNALKLTVLGGTEIRLDETYVRNFGVSAANEIQDNETERWVREEQTRRDQRAMNPHPSSRNPDRSPAPVTVVESILSEKGWTPILNDSLILGAITAGQDFALGLTPAEQADWNAMNGAKANKTAVVATRFGDTPALIIAWKSFLNSQKRMFFFPWGGPRVLTRELLGLSYFGYRPEFSWHQIRFHAGAGKRVFHDFRTYLQKLSDVGFHEPTNQAKIMETISMYLFNDRTAIGSPWPPTTKTAV